MMIALLLAAAAPATVGQILAADPPMTGRSVQVHGWLGDCTSACTIAASAGGKPVLAVMPGAMGESAMALSRKEVTIEGKIDGACAANDVVCDVQVPVLNAVSINPARP